MSNKLFVGIDVSLKENQLQCLDADGNFISKSKRFANNLPGTMDMINYLKSIMDKGNFESLTIGMEATSSYWFPLFHTLASSNELKNYSVEILSLNPKLISNFRKAYTDMDKNDLKDSFVIADRLRFGRLPESQTTDAKYLALQRLTRYRFFLCQTKAQLKNYTCSLLFLTFSEWNRVKPFSDMFGTTAKNLLKKFHSAKKLAEVPINELKNMLASSSKNHFRDIEQKSILVNQTAKHSFSIPDILAEQIHFIIKLNLQLLNLIEQHIDRLNKKISKLMKKFKNPLLSIPGIGPVLAAGIIAEIGDISRFPGQAQLAKYAGLTWRKIQSGNFTGDLTPLTRTGNAYLRYYFIQAAQSMIKHNSEYREYYKRKFKETSRHPHKRALTLTARKLVRLVYALLSKNQLYLSPEERKKHKLRQKEVIENQTPEIVEEKSKKIPVAAQKNSTKKVKTLGVAAKYTRTQPKLEHALVYAVNT
ncbi:hypothetical protein BBF96_08255 [Anoxybacter fermentans]|uniref:Uncharacterized protein n=1 Tax=Anoxybacter fermentans TaxID=1323375 RepID=A0A3S9SYM0_9FIRM|nr:IS110 family transposase [Anoxybacter fermentans]AZR73375.1 hypothetical protein BBF96_08255 [Anoxybacter fermentans]